MSSATSREFPAEAGWTKAPKSNLSCRVYHDIERSLLTEGHAESGTAVGRQIECYRHRLAQHLSAGTYYLRRMCFVSSH